MKLKICTINCFWLLLGVLANTSLFAQTTLSVANCSVSGTQYCFDFNLSAPAATNVGVWSIFVTYDATVLSSTSATIAPAFNDPTNNVSGTDNSVAGSIQLSGVNNTGTAIPSLTCPAQLFATLCFNIINAAGNPNLGFDAGNTALLDPAFAALSLTLPTFPTTPTCGVAVNPCNVDACSGVTIVPNATAGATTCGNSNGTIVTAPTGGTAPYTTAISGGGVSGSLASGSYSVTVTDDAGCSATQGSISVATSTGITVSLDPTDNTSCTAPNGAVAATVSSGNAGATFAWSNSATTASLTGLSEGTYSVTVTKAGCTATASTTVATTSNVPTLNIISTTPNTCGAGNGGAVVSATGGVGAITYAWSNGTTGATISNVAGGTYTVTATSAGNSCSTSLTVNISNQAAPAASATATATSCGLDNGAIDIGVIGGTGALSYAWSDAGATTQDRTALASGTYSVTVTDGNGCTATATANVAASSAISASIMSDATSCGLSNGSAMAMPTGAASYTYNWSNGATTQSISNLASGNYSVTVTATGGCNATATTSIASSTGATASASATQTGCGASTGSVTVAATGSGALSYAWLPNVSTSSSATGLGAGTYNITVTDANGCTAATSASVTTAGGPTASASATNATCGNANGTISASATGGATPYTFSLDGNTAQASGDFTGVAAGAHVITVLDGNSCASTANVTVNNTAGATVTVSTTPGNCGASSGSVSASVTGGAGPFSYSWSLNGAPISGNAIITNQEEGLYSVTITDANGCISSNSATLTCNSTPICDSANNGGVCALSLLAGGVGGGGGTLIAVPAGDAVAINFTSPGIANNAGYVSGFYVCTDAACADIVAFFPGTTAQIDNPNVALLPNVEYYVMTAVVLASDPYDITAQCHEFGALSDQTFMFELGDICETTTIVVTAEPYSCASGLQVSASGGVGPYTFNPPVGAPLVNGTTNITAIDANGCIGVGSITVSNAIINGSASYNCTSGLNITITEGPAGATYSYSIAEGTTGLANGAYQVVVTASNGCSTILPFGVDCINDPCNGVSVSGTASYSCTTGLSVSGSGGVAPYSYSLANGATLANGTYTITITDSNGCAGTVSVTANCSTDVCNGVTITGSAVYGCNGGGLTVSGSGGTAPYSFVVNGNPILNGASLANGAYTINIYDANGCAGQTILTVACACTNPPSATTVAYNGTLCNSSAEGMTTVDLNSLVTGTQGGSWSGALNSGASSGTFNANGLTPGVYIVTYTVSSAGCPSASSTQSLTVIDCQASAVANNDESFVSNLTENISYDVTNNDTGCSIALTSVNSITPSSAASLVGFDANGTINLDLNATDVDIQVSYTITDCVGQTASAIWTIHVTDCGANAGSMNQPAHAKYCADQNITFQHFGVVGGAYSLAYAVVNAVTDEVAYYGPSVGSLPFSSAVPPIAPSGSYHIYGVSYETAAGLPSWPVSGGACVDISDPISVNVFAPLDTAMLYHCNGDGTINLAILLYGGAPSFYGSGAYITNFSGTQGPATWQTADAIEGLVGNFSHYDSAADAISGANLNYAGAGLLLFNNLSENIFDGGTGFFLDVDSDGALCDDSWYITMPINCPPPPPCDPIPGVMASGANGTEYACAGELATVTNIGAQFQDYDGDGQTDEVISYVLWDPSDSLATVQISPDATFDFVPLNCPAYYMAAAAVGPDANGDGYVDWDDICTKFTPNAQPVVFLCPIETQETVICDNNTGEFQIVIQEITGGQPQVDGSAYTYSGTASGQFINGTILSLGPYAAGTNYTFMINDDNGCSMDPAITGTEDCKVTAIELLSFTGEVQSNGNLLKWTTASEIENDYFTLLRSEDGVNFKAIGVIDGAGNSSSINSYNFIDKNAPSGLSYYRLDETDFNGKTVPASDVITLTRSQVSFSVIGASPVPAINSVEVAFSAAINGNVAMNIYDATGKLVNNSNINAINGINTIAIDITNYAAGVYFVQLNNRTEIITARIAKEQ